MKLTTATAVTTVNITLTGDEAVLLRNLLGGLKQGTRRGAIRKNGGTKEQAEAGNQLGSSLWKLLDENGFKKFQGTAPAPTEFGDDADDTYAEDYDPYED